MGVYYDDTGKIPLLECVRKAERQLAETAPSRGDLPIDGLQVYDKAVQSLVFGLDSPAFVEGRLVTVQALGGTGGLKIGADLVERVAPEAQVWISEPSWENHRALFEGAGFVVRTYPDYDPETRGLSFPAMFEALKQVPIGSIISLLHACCHNPTGVDLSPEQWRQVLDVVRTRSFVPFLDLAYQGLGERLEADARTVDFLRIDVSLVRVELVLQVVFALRRAHRRAQRRHRRCRRDGPRVVSTQAPRPGQLLHSAHARRTARGYRADDTRVASDVGERAGRDARADKSVRKALVDKIHSQAPGTDFSFVLRQRGMFSYSGLSRDQVARLRQEGPRSL